MPLGDEYPDYPGGSFQPQAMLQPRNPAMMAPPAPMAAPTGTTLGNEIQPRGGPPKLGAFPIIMQGLQGFAGSMSRMAGGGGAGPDLIGQVHAAQMQKYKDDRRLAQEQEALKMKRAQFAGQQMDQFVEITKLPPHLRKAAIGPWVEANKNAGFPIAESMVGMVKAATAEEGAAYSRYVRAAGLDPEVLLMTYGSEAKAIEHTNKVMEQTRKAAMDAEVGKVIAQHQGRGGTGQGPLPASMPAPGLPMGGAPPMAAPPMAASVGGAPAGMQAPFLPPPGVGMPGAGPPGGAPLAEPDPDDFQGQREAIRAQLQQQRDLRRQLNRFVESPRAKDAIQGIDNRISALNTQLKDVSAAMRDQSKGDESKGRDQIATSKFEGKWRQLQRETPGMTKLDAQREAAIWTEANYGELPSRIHALFADKPEKPEKPDKPQHLATRVDPSGRVILSERVDGKVVQTDLGPARTATGAEPRQSLRDALILRANGHPAEHPAVAKLAPEQARRMLRDLQATNPLHSAIADQMGGGGTPGTGAAAPGAKTVEQELAEYDKKKQGQK